MTEEDEEFNRIERESRTKQDYVRDIKTPSREALMAEVVVLTELVRALSDKVAELESHPKQEPIAYLCENAVGHKYFRWKKPSSAYKPVSLYTTPPQRKPLTDERIADIVIEMNGNEPTALFWRDLAQAIEAAHGIKE